MSDLWYATVGSGEPLTQGHIIFDCPLVSLVFGPDSGRGHRYGTRSSQARPGRVPGRCDREVFTVPRDFLESLLAARGRQRPRLLSPNREHLAQAFARFFMRVGLPVPVDVTW